MARPYRMQAEHCFYHITSRGDDRKKIYVSDRFMVLEIKGQTTDQDKAKWQAAKE